MPSVHVVFRQLQKKRHDRNVMVEEVCSLTFRLTDNIVLSFQIVTLRWFGISIGFDHIVNEHIKKCTTLNVCEDFIWQYLRSELLQANQLWSSHRNLLQLLMKKYFCYVQELMVPVAFFSEMHSILEATYASDSGTVAMPQLTRITVNIGEEWGKLLMSHIYDNLKIRCVL
ncbi:hypothetical protein COOONC_04122 [Cooperia oncophora]